MATKKTRAQLQTESDATFLDNSTGQIVPENHRIYNDNVGESAAILKDSNTFEQETYFDGAIDVNNGINVNPDAYANFYATINSAVGDDVNAVYSQQGNILLEEGDLDVGGQTNLNTTFIRTLQNAFDPTIYYATNPTLDLSLAEGNIIYIEGDGEINSWMGVQGRIYHAIFTGNVWWNANGGDVAPETNIHIFPSDTLIFVFTTTSAIRIIGIHRASVYQSNQYNGQNYFQINHPQDALNLASSGQLDIGATYKVMGAFELGKLSGVYYDVYLRAKTQDIFESTCYISHDDSSNGVLQKALFTGNFDQGSILISDYLDTAVGITYPFAATNYEIQFALTGAKAYIEDGNIGFFGDATFATDGGKPIYQNLLNVETTDARYGRIMNVSEESADRWITHSKYATAGTILFGNKWYTTGLPSVSAINTLFASIIGSGTTTLTSYRLSYTVVNEICTLNFYCELTGSFTYGASGREVWVLLPTPFLISAGSYFSTGTCRNGSGNHQDQGVIAMDFVNSSTDGKYFKITSKFSTQSNNQSLIISGSITFPVTT